ncbi:MAG: MBL fold metallo-hydrolase [Pseudolabrys sp.]|nr:MBL fold metallo-hydrolase [Pseudolabrys sp.]
MVGPIVRIALRIAGLALSLGVLPLHPAAAQGAAPAQPDAKPEMRVGCPGLIATRSPLFQRASLRLAALNADQVRLTFIGHATFLLESPQLVRIATDYNDYVRPSVTPDIVTMNHAHSTHYTNRPDPGITHVLRGWAEDEKPARIDLTYKDVRVRNVPTNIRTWGGSIERHGNSIFIFEVAGLCMAHLGHLHGTLTQAQLDEMGRVDVVMVPVDGSYTLDLDGMIEVLHALKAPLLIPMHYFNRYSLERFLERMKQEWDIETLDVPSTVLSKATLPVKPKILVLPGH